MNKGAWIAIVVIVIILIGGIILFNSGSNKETTTGTSANSKGSPISEYQNIQTSNDVFNSIDESLNFIE